MVATAAVSSLRLVSQIIDRRRQQRQTASTHKTLFEKIIAPRDSATIVYEDELCLAFRDINPAAPTHILLIPKKPIARLCDATSEDQLLLGHLLLIGNKIADAEGFGEAYRLVVNNGGAAGQSVFHLHLHIIAGRPLKWPPG